MSQQATGMMYRFLVILLMLLAAPAQAQFGAQDRMVQAELVSDHRSVAPGQTFRLGLYQDIEEGWHTYWRNPGDSGDRTRMTFSLPEDWQISEIIWPEPGLYSLGPLRNYGYGGEVTLPVEVTVPEDAPPGPFLIRMEATWLVCEEICIPEEGTFEKLIEIGDPELDTAGSFLISQAYARRPYSDPSVQSGLLLDNDTLVLTVAAPGLFADARDIRDIAFLPFEPGVIQHSAEQRIQWTSEGLALGLEPSRLTRDGVQTRHGGILLFDLEQDCRWAHYALEIEPVPGVQLLEASALVAQTSTTQANQVEGALANIGFNEALWLAFIAGLLLNLMPCVFPVLSMKALHLVESRESRIKAMEQGLLFATGVMVTFLGLGVALLLLRDLGLPGGWGFQLQLPIVVASLSLLMIGIGLNLLGWFEVGTSLQGVGGSVNTATRRGALLTGMLAVFVAAPCLAPFMAAALTFAFAQPTHEALAIFAGLGAGLAFPFIIMTFVPGALNLLPRPGPWMVRFRQILSLPMFATGAWLAWVLFMQTGVNGLLALGAGLLALLLATRLFNQSNGFARVLGAMGIVAVIAAVLVTSRLELSQSREPGGQYEAWSRARVAELQSENRPVFVDFTAAWCVTCQVNKLGTLSSDEVQTLFEDNNVALLRADFTNRDPEIEQALAETGLVGVPRYLIYPADGREPIVLPALLNAEIIADAIDQAR